jgi:hypothetical protein
MCRLAGCEIFAVGETDFLSVGDGQAKRVNKSEGLVV